MALSKILCTFPGKFGDLLWALPTVRAISEHFNTPVDLQIAGAYGRIAELIEEQPYIGACYADPAWIVQQTAPITPAEPPAWPEGYDRIVPLGYTGWPEPTLALDIYSRACRRVTSLLKLDLDRPWLHSGNVHFPKADQPRVVVGWSEEHFELKVGLLLLLASRFRDVQFWWLRPWHGRYDEIDTSVQVPDSNLFYNVFGPNVGIIRCGWSGTVSLMATATVFLGCLSAPWVVANGVGIPTVICEPNPQRHHPVFWRESPKNHLVRGGDGQPTFDARHVGDTLKEVLGA